MKKFVMNNMVESSIPPANTSLLWVCRTGDGEIEVINRYRNGEWQPYLVSVDYLKPDKEEEKND